MYLRKEGIEKYPLCLYTIGGAAPWQMLFAMSITEQKAERLW